MGESPVNRDAEDLMVNRRSQRGQAAVEAALTLPVSVFLILGTLQLFMMLQGRVMAEYAAFKAVRAGSVNHGECEAMNHAAILALMPSYHSFLGNATGAGSPGDKLGQAFRARRGNNYVPGIDSGHDGNIVWIIRERPDPVVVASVGGEDREFDQPSDQATLESLRRLEIQMVYWYPLRIPFANWVIARAFLAQYGIEDYTNMNPLMPTQTAAWTQEVAWTWRNEVRTELARRVRASQYVIPIHTNATMRMMTPARRSNFRNRACAPAPLSL